MKTIALFNPHSGSVSADGGECLRAALENAGVRGTDIIQTDPNDCIGQLKALAAQQPDLFVVWGGDGTLEGRVRAVEPAAFTKVSALGVEEQRVRVLIDLTSPPERWQALGDGFRVGVRVVTRALPKVVKAPVSAVFPQPEGGHAVFVVDGGRGSIRRA